MVLISVRPKLELTHFGTSGNRFLCQVPAFILIFVLVFAHLVLRFLSLFEKQFITSFYTSFCSIDDQSYLSYLLCAMGALFRCICFVLATTMLPHKAIRICTVFPIRFDIIHFKSMVTSGIDYLLCVLHLLFSFFLSHSFFTVLSLDSCYWLFGK